MWEPALLLSYERTRLTLGLGGGACPDANATSTLLCLPLGRPPPFLLPHSFGVNML